MIFEQQQLFLRADLQRRALQRIWESGSQPVRDTWITHPGDAGMKAIAERILETLGL